MSSEKPADADYPYAYRPPAVLRPADFSSSPAQRHAGRFIWIWFLRLALAAGVTFAMIALPVGIVAYRARSQAAMVEVLENRGCRVDYSTDPESDTILKFFQQAFGNPYFGEIDSVAANGLNAGDVVVVCYACRKFDHLENFEISSDAFSFSQIATWGHLDRLKLLSIESKNITDEDLIRIGQMPNLTWLDLASPQISDKGLSYLAGLKKLETFGLESSGLNGLGPANVRGFPRLEQLRIRNSPNANDKVILNLGPMPALKGVAFDGTRIGDQGIAHIAVSENLLGADLDETQITDAALESLSNCSRLWRLDLTNAQITDEGIVHLARCSELTELSLAGTKVTGKGLGVMLGQNIELNLDRTKVTDEGLRDAAQIQGLSTLSLQDTKVTGTGVRFFSHSVAQPSVDLSGATLTPDGIATLAKSKISSLILDRTPIDDKLLMLFAENNDTNLLRISETKVTAAGLRAFYEGRKQRLAKAGRQEWLYVVSDFEGVADTYLPDPLFGGIVTEGDPMPEPVEGEQPPQTASPETQN